MSGGVKFDGEKPRLALLPMRALEEVGKVLTFGAQKYGDANWHKGIAYSRLASAALRHVFAWLRGEDIDEESGLHHLAHAMCCLLFILTFILEGRDGELDDRPYLSPSTRPTSEALGVIDEFHLKLGDV